MTIECFTTTLKRIDLGQRLGRSHPRTTSRLVVANSYSQDRLARLLRLLAPAPERWVASAQRAIAEMLARDRASGTRLVLGEIELSTLSRALDLDPTFRESFDADPVAAVEAAGWPMLARSLEREITELVALAERIAADAAFREELHEHPVTTLEESGLPFPAIEPLLEALQVPEEVRARVPEVVAHHLAGESSRSRLLLLIIENRAVVGILREVIRPASGEETSS